MSHKEIWNCVVHSRTIFPLDHPLHDLDVIVLGVSLFLGMITYFVISDWRYCRWIKKRDSVFEVWERAWKLQQRQEELSRRLKRVHH